MDSFTKKMVQEQASKIEKIVDLTPEQYNRIYPSIHPVMSKLTALEIEIKSLLFWLERLGVLDNKTDN